MDEQPGSLPFAQASSQALCVWYILSRQPPLREPGSRFSMDSCDVALGVSKLRRELEEILAIVKADPTNGVRLPAEACPASAPDQPSADRESDYREASGVDQSRDELFDDALVVVTEFGQATPSILQMWLSIDYNRAARILSQFEAEGLVSSKGKIRHKAYALRRSSSHA